MRLLAPEPSEASQFARENSNVFGVGSRFLPSRLGGLQKERSSILFAKHIDLGCLDCSALVGNPRGDDHVPTLGLWAEPTIR
jgi:hypothetical protein